ncbi:MAG: hypothetical protein AAF961_19430, partial [Planctomycetota bacterium]
MPSARRHVLLASSLALWASFSQAQSPSARTDLVVKPPARVDAPPRRTRPGQSFAWQGQALLSSLNRLSELHNVCCWLDRRVDPNYRVEVAVSDATVLNAIEAIAEQQGLATAIFEEVVYVGPASTARDLPTLGELARRSLAERPRRVRTAWLRRKAFSWPRLSEPRRLVERIAAEAGAKLANGEPIPHDLWETRQLPPMRAIDRMTLILSGFDLRCTISDDGSAVSV